MSPLYRIQGNDQLPYNSSDWGEMSKRSSFEMFLAVMVMACVNAASFAGWLSPRIQWPNNYPQYWGQQYDPYYGQQPQQQRPVQRPRKPVEKKSPPKTRASADDATSSSGNRKPAEVQEEIESANPLQQHRTERAIVPADVKLPERSSDAEAKTLAPPTAPPGTTLAFVWDDADSLDRIASACGTNAADVLRQNALRRSELRDGQVLQLPKPAGGAPQLSAFEPGRQRSREIWRGIRGQKRVALTFDAGGEDDAATDLLKYLTEAKAPATFFVTGQFAAEHTKLVKEIDQAGYPIHNHSWSHPEFTKISDDKIDEELERTEWAIRDATGKTTKPFWRPPFGDRDNRVQRVAAEAGYQSIYWTLDSLDSVGEKKDPEFIVSRILNPPKSGDDPDRYLDGAIILMHVGEAGTARAVPLLIKSLRDRGFKLVTVDEIVGAK